MTAHRYLNSGSGFVILPPDKPNISAQSTPPKRNEPTMKPLFTLSLLLLLSLACQAAAQTAERVSAPEGKKYIYKNTDGKPLVMEIYFPENHTPSEAKVPGLIMFHGGGWGGGTLEQFRYACQYFASRGLVAATVQYTLAKKTIVLPKGQSRKRVCIVDAKSAIRWMKQHADELGIDPNRLITGGGSAGGHICMLATNNPGLNDPADPKEFDTSVAAYLLFNPAFSAGDSKDPQIDILQHLKAEFPPAIVFFGTNDNWKEGFDAAHAKLESMGNTNVDLQLAQDQKHAFFNRQPWADVTIAAADEFLVALGLLDGKATLAVPATGETLQKVK